MGILILVGVEGPNPKLGLGDLVDILQEWRFATKPDWATYSICSPSLLAKNEILQHKAALGFV